MGRRDKHIDESPSPERHKIKRRNFAPPIPMETPSKRAHRKVEIISSSSDDNDETAKLEVPLYKHGCTDILCTILFLVFITGLVVISIFAYMNGKPAELLLPKDSYGRKCGKDADVADKKLLLFHDLTKCLQIRIPFGCATPQVCVSQCPDDYLYEKIPSHLDKLKKFAFSDKFKNTTISPSYTVPSKPFLGRCIPAFLTDIYNGSMEILAKDPADNSTVPITFENAGGVATLTFKVLKDGINYVTDLLNLKKTFEYAFEDVQQSVEIIVVALIVGAAISLLWILLLRLIIRPMVYLAFVTVTALLAFALYYSINTYIGLKNDKKPALTVADLEKIELGKALDLDYITSLEETWLALSIIIGVILGILVLIFLFLRKRIELAIELIRESSKAVIAIPTSLVWPLIPFLLQVGIIFYTISVCVFLSSSSIPLYKIVERNTTVNITDVKIVVGDLCDPVEFYKKYVDSDFDCFFYKNGFNSTYPLEFGSVIATKYFNSAIEFINDYQAFPQIYVIFMLFWLIAFVMAFNEMVLAGAFGAWYWTRFANTGTGMKNKLPIFPLGGSIKRALLYHLGTLAFGSLLIAILKMIRLGLEYVDRKLKEAGAKENRVAIFIMKCLKCLFWIFEKFIKFLNKNSYIITAIYGYNFFKASKKAFTIVVSNVVRVAVLDKVTDFILFLSKLVVTALMGVLSFFVFTSGILPELHYYFVPMFLIIFGVYIIANLFFDVFAMCVDTLFMCALIDLENNDGSRTKRYFMSTKLRSILGVKQKPIKKQKSRR